ncbi:MAG TPA: hypothetical protein ACYCDB_00470 [Candidatus Azoamicus sp.]
MLNLNVIKTDIKKLNKVKNSPESIVPFVFLELPIGEFITVEHCYKFCTWIIRSKNFRESLYLVGLLSLSFKQNLITKPELLNNKNYYTKNSLKIFKDLGVKFYAKKIDKFERDIYGTNSYSIYIVENFDDISMICK